MAAIGWIAEYHPLATVARGNDGGNRPRRRDTRRTDRPPIRRTQQGNRDGVSGHVAAAAQVQPAQTASMPPETPFPSGENGSSGMPSALAAYPCKDVMHV
jgi:hypothetical protein